ncbi:protein transport Sec1b [Sesamum angolense]|uniref:Protein transport Sec1b n=1 Tax=Sesamum angolense TaxID=2727404 RepID=A0AAE2BTN0_9LAMI|nr:protein transport Sec1b [Sesamum angolense]
MSFSDSETSSHGGDYKTFRQVSRDRLLYEMLQTSNPGDSRSPWKEFPFVRYKAAKLDGDSMTSFRELVPTKLAAAVWDQITTYKSSIRNFPQTETCELLIVDRSVDQIAPVIHEWTYDAMCHDLLNLEGNKYVHEEGTNENKLRLMMVYAAVYPEKFEGDKALKLMQLRACHKLTAKLRREVVLGTTSLDDPSQYITVYNSLLVFSLDVPQKLKSLSEKELSVDDIKI